MPGSGSAQPTRGGKSRGKKQSGRSVNCLHWRQLPSVLPVLRDLAVATRPTPTADGTLISRSNENGDASKNGKCPHRIDCHLCNCVTCDYRICLSSTTAHRDHFNKTGHLIGYSKKFARSSSLSVFCFKCGTFFDELFEFGSQKIILSLNLTIKHDRKKHLKRKRSKKKPRNARIANVYPAVICRGLFNFGNSCYINCIMQILFHIPQINNYFANHEKQLLTAQKKHVSSNEGTSFISVFINLLHEFHKMDAEPVCPTELLIVIWEKMPHVGGHRQHDAHEFFISVINLLHQEFLHLQLMEGRSSVGAPAETIIDQIFLGRMQSEVTCSVCGHSRFTDDPFFDTALEMISDKPRGVPITLCDLLDRFTRLEHLDDSNLLNCLCCGKKTKSTKQLSFKELSSIICIQLKRFCHSPRFSSGSGFAKIKTKVLIPESIDFSKYKSAKLSQVPKGPHQSDSAAASDNTTSHDWYHVFAIVNHSGTYASGHYRTYIRRPGSSWILCDDQNIQVVSQKEALESEAYLLFFKKGHALFPFP